MLLIQYPDLEADTLPERLLLDLSQTLTMTKHSRLLVPPPPTDQESGIMASAVVMAITTPPMSPLSLVHWPMLFV